MFVTKVVRTGHRAGGGRCVQPVLVALAINTHSLSTSKGGHDGGALFVYVWLCESSLPFSSSSAALPFPPPTIVTSFPSVYLCPRARCFLLSCLSSALLPTTSITYRIQRMNSNCCRMLLQISGCFPASDAGMLALHGNSLAFLFPASIQKLRDSIEYSAMLYCSCTAPGSGHGPQCNEVHSAHCLRN